MSKVGGSITRRAGMTQGPPSVIDLVEKRTGRASRLMLKDEDSHHGTSPMVNTGAAASETVPTGKGNYQLMGEIARGGMGIVMKGHDTDLGRDVAMKVLLQEHASSDSILQRFVEEAQIGGQLQHPGIVPVYELGLLDDDRPYFTMKLVKGRTLAALFSERTKVEEGRRRFLTIFEQVCQTIAYAHARRVVHRDLKPANIMVGAFGEVQVVDWGLAKVLQEGGIVDERRAQQTQVSIIETVRSAGSSTAGSQSLVGSVMGTPSYMSPEQAQGEIERLDERTDVFSLGAILAEILTGRPAYTGDEDRPVTEAARALQTGLHNRLDACDAAPELVDLARRCLAPGKELRPRNAGALAKEVHDYLASSEERARQAELQATEARVKAVQERKARRLTLALATTVLVAIVGGGLGYLHVEQQKADQRAAADKRRFEVTSKVTGILGDAQLRRGQGEYVTALVALDQADTVLAATTDADPELGPAVADLRAGVLADQREEQEALLAQAALDTLLTRLVDIELSRGGGSDNQVQTRRDADYAQTFTDYGVEVFEGEEGHVVARLRETGHPVAVAHAFDDWSRIKLYLDGFGTLEFGRLIRMARELDPDPWRLKLRNALLADDRRALEKIANSPEVHSWPPATVAMFVESIRQLGHGLDLVPILRGNHIRHPDNHFIAYLLGLELANKGRFDEALPYANTAHSLRPDFGRAVILQLNVLIQPRRWEELQQYYLAKRDLYRDRIEDDADEWMTTWTAPRVVEAIWLRGHHERAISFMETNLETSSMPSLELNNLAWYLAMHPNATRADLLKAVSFAERAIAESPDEATYNTLATLCYKLGRHRDALTAIRTSMEMAGGGNEFDWLLTSMILHELGVEDQAELWYERARTADQLTPSIYDNNPFRRAEDVGVDELQVFRDEARAMFSSP